MASEKVDVGPGVWLQWVLASTVGLAAGATLSGAVRVAFGLEDLAALEEVGSYGRAAAGAASAAVVGASVGSTQWLVLRRYISQAGWWVLASAAGLAVGTALDVIDTIAWFVGIGAIGASVGTMQWLVLRRQLSQSGWWILVGTVSWLVAYPTSFAIADRLSSAVGGTASLATGFAVGGSLVGGITGGLLVWLLKRPTLECLVLPPTPA